jgi:DmsE family decaheme c-type cytochrome
MFMWSRRTSSRLLAPIRGQLDAFRRPAKHLSRLGIIVVIALAWRAYADAPKERAAPIPKVAEQCAQCHEAPVASWAKTVHRRTAGAPQLAADRQGCGGCHTGLAAHLEDPSAHPPYIKDMKGEQIAALCLSCHKGGKQMMWHTTSHSKLAKGCLECHDPHNGEGRVMLAMDENALCSRCHPQQVAETHLPSHHPIPEGKMSCTDCHNVHGDMRGNLPSESNSEMCYKCHSDKAGPFVGEHPPVTEDCTICHKPHGSQNDRLLLVDQPMLCLRCHPGHHDDHRTPLVATSATPAGAADAIAGIEFFYEKCTSCHFRIHGTDLVSQTGNPTFMPGGPVDPSFPQRHASGTNAGYYLGAAGLSALGLQGGGASWGFSDLELGTIDEDGNPTFVREYDGKNYEFPRAKIGVDQYSDKSDFHFRLKDPAARDEEGEVYFGNPKVSADLEYTALTHRQPRFNDVQTPTPILIPGGPSGGVGRQNFLESTDLADGKNDYQIKRQVIDMNLAARHPKLRQVRWLASYWRQSKTGSQQFLYLTRCGSCHKFQTTEPVDNVTTEASGGAEIDLNKAAVRYLHTEGRFENRAPETIVETFGLPSLATTNVPLFGLSDYKSRADEVRLTAMPTSRLAVDGLWRSRSRHNLFNGFTLDIDSAGGGAAWQLAKDVSLIASYLSSDFDNGTRVYNPESISRERKTARGEVRYTGVKYTLLSAGYKHEKVDRDTEHAPVPASSTAKTWSANAITNLPSGLGLNVRYRKTTTDIDLNFNPLAPPEEVIDADGVVAAFPSRWIAPPNDEKLFSAVATYNVRQDLLASLLYSKIDRSYDVDVSLFNPVTLEAVGIARNSGDDIKTLGAEAYYTRGKRTRVVAGIYKQEGSGNSDVRYGTVGPAGIVTLIPPYVPVGTSLDFPAIESLATFDYNANILRLEASHWLTPRLRLFGRYARTRSDGQVVAHDLGDYVDQNPDLNGLALILNPFDITLQDKWIGVGYLVDPDTEIALSFQRRDWENKADRTQDGSYDLWRLGVRKSL